MWLCSRAIELGFPRSPAGRKLWSRRRRGARVQKDSCGTYPTGLAFILLNLRRVVILHSMHPSTTSSLFRFNFTKWSDADDHEFPPSGLHLPSGSISVS
ncbi:hypothetical protein B0H12DRAFT_47789 [Mycena haematopus]|nr:hypothetical protein B0H12DRAFT_47789 [Mycena haematopus]